VCVCTDTHTNIFVWMKQKGWDLML